MEALLGLSALALALIGIGVGTVDAIRKDGYRQRPTRSEYDTRNPS